jgi:nucleoside-diphosphate-sugar epimerase
MKIVVIGAGWLGLPLAEKWAAAGHKVVATRRTKFPQGTAGIHWDRCDPESGIFPSSLADADLVVLSFPPSRSSTDQYRNHANAIAQRISSEAKLILVSSTGVYPDAQCTYTETDWTPEQAQDSVLGACEWRLQQALGTRVTIVRMAGLVGGERWPVRFMSRSGKTYNGDEPVNLIHQEDAVGLLQFIVEQKLWGEVINGCAPHHPTKVEHYTLLAQQLGIPVPNFVSGGNGGKTIVSEKSLQLGYTYQFPDPNQFHQGIKV